MLDERGDPAGGGTGRSLSIVIPAFDEEESLEISLIEILGVLDEHDYQAGVIVVDDGSTDGTASVAKKIGARDPRVRVLGLRRNMGKSHALQVGIEEAGGRRRDPDGRRRPGRPARDPGDAGRARRRPRSRHRAPGDPS